jgi:threonyl-tRNA synthetase
MAEKKEKSSSAKATEDKQIFKVRHSLSHLLATAVLEKYPETKLGIGPVIENGFYYDFDFKKPISESDLLSLEGKIRELIKEKISFKKKLITPIQGRKLFKKAPYKLQLANELIKAKKPLSIYISGKFTDLCSGPHVKNTSEINPDAFKLMSLAGAYWKGSEKNPMLTRIYGVAFGTKKELEEYLKNEEEAKRRDHRKIGKEMELFCFDDLVGKGLPLWLPNGTIIKDEIEKLAVEMEEKYGYLRVSTPHLAKEEMYIKSGHLPYYKDSMYPPMKIDDGTYYLKAMNCPHHHVIYRSKPRSYKELPLRLAEYGTVYRNELSGTLAGLLRVRSLQMNDAHIYCAKDQIEDEFKRVLELTLYYFKIFGLNDYSFRLSKWGPKNKDKYVNEPSNWKYSEDILRKILKGLKVKFVEASDEAAFYGPKVDVQLKSIVGREETMSTIQLDFAAKKRFNLTYKDKSGRENNEIFVIHRAPLSTHERFIAFLIEQYAGEFPVWLAPIQTEILPVSEKQSAYTKQLYEKLRQQNVRVHLSDDNETLGKRIREAELKKIPYILVAGERESKSGTVNVRSRRKEQLGEMDFEKFSKDVKKEIEERK